MKRSIFILLTILIFGCSNQKQQKTDPRIEIFETFLGKEESNALNNLVETFELFLKYNFENSLIEDSYKEYLQKTLEFDLNDITWFFNKEIQNETFELYKSSGLEYETYIKPIEVWKEGRLIKDHFRYIDNVDTFEIKGQIKVPPYFSSVQQDSIIKQMKNIPMFNRYGRFMRGLDLIKENDSAIINYLDVKDALGNPPSIIIVADILAKDSDFSDYFLKRIIVVELYKFK